MSYCLDFLFGFSIKIFRKFTYVFNIGGLTEWSNVPVLKTGGLERVPGVRIPQPPQKLDQ